MNNQNLQLLLADLRPNQVLRLGFFPDREIAKEKKREIDKLIKQMKRNEILTEDLLTLIKRTPEGYCLLIYSLPALKAEILEISPDGEIKKKKEVKL